MITLQQAKDHLRIATPDGHAGDADLVLKLEQAEAIIVDYLTRGGTSVYADLPLTAADLPIVDAMILLQLGELYTFRGDDAQAPPHTDGHLSPAITNLGRRLRGVAFG
jgi:hypothetical protein